MDEKFVSESRHNQKTDHELGRPEGHRSHDQDDDGAQGQTSEQAIHQAFKAASDPRRPQRPCAQHDPKNYQHH
jgi:hypothetical protein